MDNLTAGNPTAHRVRVYYEGGSTIAEGMPLCYDFDTTDNWFGGSVADTGEVTATGTTAEGSHNEGKYIRVVDPALANLDWFAGVVAKGGWNGRTGPRVLDIYVPNGAIVPVKTVLAATVVGRTILSINSGTLTFGNPTTDVPDFATTSSADTAGTIDARPVAVAMETISAAGLVLAKLCPDLFVHQGGQVDYEMQVAAGTVNCSVNRRQVDFKNTAGHCQLLHYRANLTGAGGDGNLGVYRFETFIQGIPASGKHVFGVKAHLELGADWGGGGGHGAPLQITLRTKNVDPDLSSMSHLSAVHIDWILRKDTTNTLTNMAPQSSIFYINIDSTGSVPEYFVWAEHPYAVAQEATAVAQDDSAARSIKVAIGMVEYWIPTYTAAELA